MPDLRNELNIELARLRRTDDLFKRLPLYDVELEPKLDGQRYSFQHNPGDEEGYLISRSRKNKTKGVDVAKKLPFVDRKLEPFMHFTGMDYSFILDGELCAVGESTSSEVTRLDTEKEFVAFDIIWCNGKDLRKLPRKDRMQVYDEVMTEISFITPKIKRIQFKHFDVFTEDDLRAAIKVATDAEEEGFCVKENARDYDKNWYGWKIKPEDTEDAFIVAVSEEKKHSHGDVTKTGNCGAAGVAQWKKDGKSMLVAWVPLPAEGRVPLEEKEKLLGKVLEFKHNGWEKAKKRFRFPQFVQWRADGDKSVKDCKFPH